MSALLAKMKAEKERLAKKAESREGGFDKVEWFKPEDGENTIRFLPHWKKPDRELPFLEVRVHFIEKKATSGKKYSQPTRCLRDFEKDCPACDQYDIEVKKDREKARRLHATTRYLYNVIDYANKKVVPYACPSTVHEVVISYWNDIGEDMFSVEEGYDWKIVKKAGKGAMNTSYAARPFPKPGAVPSKMRGVLGDVVDLKTLYAEDGEADLIEFAGGSKKKSADDDDEDDDIPVKSKAKKKPVDDDEDDEEEEPASKKKKKVDDDDEDDGLPFYAKKVAKKAKPVDEEEDEAEEDEEEPAPKKKAPVKKKPVDEDDDEEEDARSVSKAKAAAAAAKQKAKPADDDEEDEAPKAKKKKKPAEDEDDLESELRELGV